MVSHNYAAKYNKKTVKNFLFSLSLALSSREIYSFSIYLGFSLIYLLIYKAGKNPIIQLNLLLVESNTLEKHPDLNLPRVWKETLYFFHGARIPKHNKEKFDASHIFVNSLLTIEVRNTIYTYLEVHRTTHATLQWKCRQLSSLWKSQAVEDNANFSKGTYGCQGFALKHLTSSYFTQKEFRD